MIDIKFTTQPKSFKAGITAILVPVSAKRQLWSGAGWLPAEVTEILARTLPLAPKFEAAPEQTLALYGLHPKAPLVIAYGVGDAPGKHAGDVWERIGASLVATLQRESITQAVLINPSSELAAAHIVFGAQLRNYRYSEFVSKPNPEQAPLVQTLTVLTKNAKEAAAEWAPLRAVAMGTYLARDLVTQPPNRLTPQTFVAEAKKAASELPVKVKALGKAQLERLGFGALLAVGSGSSHDPQLLIIEYYGAPKKAKNPPLVYVGKGITFDTGGYNIKTGGALYSMADMKTDMAGGAAVTGAVLALAQQQAPVNVIGLVALAENMVDEDAYRPSDIIKTLSGHMVEIKDTDAEGRLVLADAMWYGQQTYKPKIVVDIATLTGAVGFALGNEYAGLFSNHQPLASDLLGAGKTTFEKLWQLPLHKNFDKQLQSLCADFTNLGNQPMPGASTAAQFLQRFVQKDVHWAHIDMAWLAFSKTDLPLSPAGATGFGVRLLHYFALQQNNLLD